jgi:hypothetical protein
MNTWVVLQLREGLSPSMPVADLEREFRRRCPTSAFHFPAVRQGCLDPENPMSAYVLVQPPVDASIEQSGLVAGVLKDPVSRRPLTVSDADVQRMSPLPLFPPPGSSVLVTAGDYTGLEGTVVEVNCSTCKVLVELWSRQSVLTLAVGEFAPV